MTHVPRIKVLVRESSLGHSKTVFGCSWESANDFTFSTDDFRCTESLVWTCTENCTSLLGGNMVDGLIAGVYYGCNCWLVLNTYLSSLTRSFDFETE